MPASLGIYILKKGKGWRHGTDKLPNCRQCLLFLLYFCTRPFKGLALIKEKIDCMKRFLLGFSLLGSVVTYGQITPTFFQYGPKIGVQMTKVQIIDNPTEIESSNRFRLQGGIFTRFNVGKFSLQPEFVYDQKGGRFTTPAQTHNYSYLTTPVLLGYTPIKGVYFEAGPEFGWALNAGKVNETTSVYGPERNRDMGITVGTRINMLDAFSLVSLNIRYTQGLENTTMRFSNTTPLDFRNRTLQLSVTYTFSEYYKWWRKQGNKLTPFKKK